MHIVNLQNFCSSSVIDLQKFFYFLKDREEVKKRNKKKNMLTNFDKTFENWRRQWLKRLCG